MSISSVATAPVTALNPSGGANESRYTAVVDQYAKTLASGSTASFDEQYEAFSGLMKLLWGKDENGETAILWRANPAESTRAGDILMNSDMMKRAWAAEERLGRVQRSLEPEMQGKLEKGISASAEEYLLKAFTKLSTEDQKLVFAANGHGSVFGITDGNGTRSSGIEFASLEDFKGYMKSRADAFARDHANRPKAAEAAVAGLSGIGESVLDKPNPLKRQDAGKQTGNKASPASPGLRVALPTSGMINAAVALQVLQSAANAADVAKASEPPNRPDNAAAGVEVFQTHAQTKSVKLRV